MAKLNPGDTILCRLKEDAVVNPYNSDFDSVKSFDIIAVDSLGYYLFIPPYTFIKGSVTADLFFIKQVKLDKKFLGDSILYIGEGYVYKIKSQIDGCACVTCKNFYHQAVPNQENGSLICWSCRSDKHR
jgi:hypothetical protein